jgi:hypothetical protein
MAAEAEVILFISSLYLLVQLLHHVVVLKWCTDMYSVQPTDAFFRSTRPDVVINNTP